MNVSMTDYLKVAALYLPSGLVSPEALLKIQTLAQNLPPLSVTGFECRLGTNESRVDFIVRSPCIDLKLPEFFFTHPVWQVFKNFYQDWANPATELQRIVQYIWLEFDMLDQPLKVPLPCIGFTLNAETFWNSRLREMALESLIKLLQPSNSLVVESNVRNCIDLLPNSARIVHIGAMLTRPENGVRLVIKGIPSQQLADYLEQVGWKDSTNKLPTLISSLSDFVDSIGLAFDVGKRIYPRIGLECFFDKHPLLDKRGWQSFLDDYLVKEDLCTVYKANSLLSWFGFSDKANHLEVWPNNLTLLDSLFSPKAFSIFYRVVDLIKIIYWPDRPLSAKAYLAFVHSYIEPNAHETA